MRSGSEDEQERPRTNRRWDERTLDFIYEHTKEGPNLQFEDSKQLDTKITAVFAAATAAIGFAARLPNTRGPDIGYEVASWSGHINAVDLLFYLAVVAWGGVTVVSEIKRRIVVDIRQAYIHNKSLLNNKVKTFNRAVSWATAEGAFLVIALTLARVVGA
jgi:hypothetical protein